MISTPKASRAARAVDSDTPTSEAKRALSLRLSARASGPKSRRCETGKAGDGSVAVAVVAGLDSATCGSLRSCRVGELLPSLVA